MSSMRNAVQRRNHKERAQPLERERWGLLEKHADYSLRAKDYNAKKTRLKTLRSKAAERNPDEFFHSMLSSETRRGRKIASRGNPVLDHDAVQLLKTQDLGYLRTLIQRTRKQIARLKQEIDQSSTATTADYPKRVEKTVFVSTMESQQYQNICRGSLQDPDRHKDGHEASSRSKDRSVQHGSVYPQKYKIEHDRQEAKLIAFQRREADLRQAENELEDQRAMITNTAGSVNRSGVKFKIRARKR